MNDREYEQMYRAEETHWWYQALHNLIMRYVGREHSRKGELVMLDAGCGTGRLCRLLERYGAVTGFDRSVLALDFCRKRGIRDVFQADLNEVSLGNEKYDVITSIDVLYHRAIKDEARIVGNFYDSLKPGGILILNLVAFEALRSTHDIAVHTRKRYTRGDIIRLLRSCGFSIEKATYRLAGLFVPILCYRLVKHAINHRIGDREPPSDVTFLPPLLNALLMRVADIENRMLNTCDMPFGTSVFIVARRPGR